LKANNKKRRTIWIVASVAVVLTAVFAGGFLFRQRARADASLEPGQVVKAFVGKLSAEASASGQLLPQQEATLSVGLSGRVQTVFVEVGDAVQEGDVLLQIESDALERAVRSAEQALIIQEANLAEMTDEPSAQDIEAAKAAVASAQAQLDDLLAGADAKDLAAAEAAVASAQAQLDDLLAGASTEDLTQAETALNSALALEAVEKLRYEALDEQLVIARQQLDMATVSLENAQYFYDALANDWQHKDYAPHSPEAETLDDARTNYAIALARYNLSAANINESTYRAAQAQVAQARVALETLTSERTVEIASAREQLAQAKATLSVLQETSATQLAAAQNQLAQAEANLTNLLQGASAEQIAIVKAQVAQARINLDNAQARLADVQLVAPFGGVVTAVYLAEGEWATGPAVELTDTSSLEVVLDVDEVDIGQITLGQRTRVTLETWPDEEFEGEVVRIAPIGSTQTEIVTYQVHIRLDPGDYPVRTGMTANAELITSERDGVLLVANRAITVDRDENKYFVHRVDGETISKTEVTIGVRDGSYTEITSGLQQGDTVIIDYAQSDFPFGPGQGQGQQSRFSSN
jgi:HlyD family secretion protein